MHTRILVAFRRTLAPLAFLSLLLIAVPTAFAAKSQNGIARSPAQVALHGAASAFAARGGLDCNGLSAIQRPLKASDICTDFRGDEGRGEDNGHYVGHDEPSVGFYSNAPDSGNNIQWAFTLPRESKLPATQ